MKTRLDTKIGSKTPRKRVQNTPNHESAFGVQSAVRHFWSAERHFKSSELAFFELWPNALQVTIRHTIFNLFTKDEYRFAFYTS